MQAGVIPAFGGINSRAANKPAPAKNKS